MATITLGSVFVVVKAVEYQGKVAHGLTAGVDQFLDFMEMKHAHRVWRVAMGAFVLALVAAIAVARRAA